MNRKPDVMVLQPEHRELFKTGKYSAIRFGMPAPAFVAELVSPGKESSTNYKRDYIWKRQQYEWWGIPEYWIVDRHRAQITILRLVNGVYEETVYTGDMDNPIGRVSCFSCDSKTDAGLEQMNFIFPSWTFKPVLQESAQQLNFRR